MKTLISIATFFTCICNAAEPSRIFFENHSYIDFPHSSPSGDTHSVVHDPDCGCSDSWILAPLCIDSQVFLLSREKLGAYD